MQWKREFFDLLEKYGYKIAKDNVVWSSKKFNCEWYYDTEVVFEVVREDNHRLILIPVGDILVYNPAKPEEDFFEWKHDRSNGELTEWLIKNGHWEMNNWFEVVELNDKKHVNSGDDTISYRVEDAFDVIKGYLKPRIWSVS